MYGQVRTGPWTSGSFDRGWGRRRRTALSMSYDSYPCLVFVRIFRKILTDVCLSGFFCFDSVRCPDFRKKSLLSVCPVGQGREIAVRTSSAFIRRRLA